MASVDLRNPRSVATKPALLSAVDDIEIVALELFDLLANHGKATSKGSAVEESTALIELLISKDKEIQELIKVAKNQSEIQETVDKLQREVDKQQEDIKKLQTQLKEAESLLSNAVYQAKQKLEHIRKSNRNPVLSEELIKYAHKISASNSVSCPPGWTPGDQRRPYPSEMEMRMGWLGKMSDPSWNFVSHGERIKKRADKMYLCKNVDSFIGQHAGHMSNAVGHQGLPMSTGGHAGHPMGVPHHPPNHHAGPGMSMPSSSPSMGMMTSPPGAAMGFQGSHPSGHMMGMDGGHMGGHGMPGHGMPDGHGMRQGMGMGPQGGPGMWSGPSGLQGLHPPHGQATHTSSPVKAPHRSPVAASGVGTIHYQPPPMTHQMPQSGPSDMLLQGPGQMHSQHGFPTGQHPHGRPPGGPPGVAGPMPGGLPSSPMHHMPHHGPQSGIQSLPGGPPPPGPHPHQPGPGNPSQKEVDDVEVMSTDSSTSSSSDSQ